MGISKISNFPWESFSISVKYFHTRSIKYNTQLDTFLSCFTQQLRQDPSGSSIFRRQISATNHISINIHSYINGMSVRWCGHVCCIIYNNLNDIQICIANSSSNSIRYVACCNISPISFVQHTFFLLAFVFAWVLWPFVSSFTHHVIVVNVQAHTHMYTLPESKDTRTSRRLDKTNRRRLFHVCGWFRGNPYGPVQRKSSI